CVLFYLCRYHSSQSLYPYSFSIHLILDTFLHPLESLHFHRLLNRQLSMLLLVFPCLILLSAKINYFINRILEEMFGNSHYISREMMQNRQFPSKYNLNNKENNHHKLDENFSKNAT